MQKCLNFSKNDCVLLYENRFWFLWEIKEIDENRNKKQIKPNQACKCRKCAWPEFFLENRLPKSNQTQTLKLFFVLELDPLNDQLVSKWSLRCSALFSSVIRIVCMTLEHRFRGLRNDQPIEIYMESLSALSTKLGSILWWSLNIFKLRNHFLKAYFFRRKVRLPEAGNQIVFSVIISHNDRKSW